jgi:riboflavin kinase/FMN adenylyltransferase
VADQDVSSTRIRSLLLDGNIEGANELLEKPYCLSGAVRHGRQIGRTLGFPTANLAFPEGKLVPKHGVYYCHAHTPFGVFGAISNVGLRPTFDDTPPSPVLEAHLFGFEGDLYEQQIQIRFIRFLRPEMRFPDPDALADAVRRDIQTAKNLAASDPILTKETI